MPNGDESKDNQEQEPKVEEVEKGKGKRGAPLPGAERLAWVNAKTSNRGGANRSGGAGRAGNRSSARKGTRGGR